MVLPAEQRLNPFEAFPVKIDAGLIVEDEFVSLQRVIEIIDEAELLVCARMHGSFETVTTVATSRLRRVHGDVGVAKQRTRCAGGSKRRGYSHAGTYSHCSASENERLAHDFENSVRDVLDDRRCTKPFKEDDELVTAQASNGVTWAGRSKDARCNLLQRIVSGVVAESIVDGLESIEINHQDGDRVEGPVTSGESMTETVEQECSVRESRQRILECLTGQLLFEGPTHSDVARVPRYGG
jgi:hypothetical protein